MTLSQLAARQFGVVSAGQLLRLGWTRKEIQGQVRRGSLHPLYREVYAVGHDRIVDHGRLLAALLSCGDGSFLSHRTAAAVWGLRPVNTRRVELTVPGINAPHRRGLVVHRSTDVAKDEGRSRNGLRVSSVPRMLIELANSESQAELERLITEAVRRRLINLPALDRALHEHQRRPGMAKLKRALRDYRPRPDRKSDLERAFDRHIKDTDIPPPERNVYIGGWEIDCYWPEFKLVVELDGRNYHSSLADMERDRKKDADLLKLGIGTFRITDLRFELEPDQILADLRTLTT
jgi:very-short-patch-repair endonuclease